MQILVLEIQRQAESFSFERGEQGLADVEVHRVPELVLTGRPTCLDARRKLSRIVCAKTCASEAREQILQSFESEEIDRLVGYIEFDVPLAVTLAAPIRLVVLNVEVAVLSQLLNQPVNEALH